MSTVPPVSAVDDSTLLGSPIFNFRVNHARKSLTKMKRRDKNAPVSTNLRSVVAPWGWVDYQVSATRCERVAIGVVDPSQGTSIADCAASHDPNVSEQAVWLGVFIFVLFGVLGAVLTQHQGSRGFLWSMLVLGIVMGVVVAVRSARKYKRIRPHSRRIMNGHSPYDPIFTGVARIAQITAAARDYQNEMEKAAKAAQLEPVPLAGQVAAAPAVIRATVWQIAIGEEAASDSAVKAGMEAVTKAVFDSIETAWAAFEGFKVLIPPESELEPEREPEPAAKVDTAQRLRELAEQIEHDRAIDQLTVDDITRINRPEAEDLPTQNVD